MSPAEFGVNFFVAMFALIDPIGANIATKKLTPNSAGLIGTP